MIALDKVKGIGPRSKMLLGKLGINDVDDLVSHYPYRYDVLTRTDLRCVKDDDEKIVIDGKVESVPLLIFHNLADYAQYLKPFFYLKNYTSQLSNSEYHRKDYFQTELMRYLSHLL